MTKSNKITMEQSLDHIYNWMSCNLEKRQALELVDLLREFHQSMVNETKLTFGVTV